MSKNVITTLKATIATKRWPDTMRFFGLDRIDGGSQNELQHGVRLKNFKSSKHSGYTECLIAVIEKEVTNKHRQFFSDMLRKLAPSGDYLYENVTLRTFIEPWRLSKLIEWLEKSEGRSMFDRVKNLSKELIFRKPTKTEVLPNEWVSIRNFETVSSGNVELILELDASPLGNMISYCIDEVTYILGWHNNKPKNRLTIL